MNIRKTTYSIDYVHILTFREHYKAIVSPYFTYKIEYAIENENTMHESVRLVFRNEGFTLHFRKEGATLIYEGDVSAIKKSNPMVEIFFDICDKIKQIKEFNKITKHKIVLDSIDILPEATVGNLLEGNKYVSHPFGNLSEFATAFEFSKNERKISFKFGNYNEGDINKYGLILLGSAYNEDLHGNVGLYSQTSVLEETSTPSFSKLKNLISEAEETITLHFNSFQ